MQISQNGLDLIKQFEGFRAQPYQDQVGLWTIGYGCRIAAPGIYPGGITLEQANSLLLQHVAPIETFLNERVSVVLSQNQYDALCSLIYNIGVIAFGNSTLLKVLNMGSCPLAANEFVKWDKINGTIVDPGLLARRQKEQQLFLEA